MKSLLLISLVLHAVLITTAAIVVQKRGGISWLTRQLHSLRARRPAANLHSDQRESMFAECPIQAGDVVFAGDSLVELGDWTALAGQSVVNRGISGETMPQVAARIEDYLMQRPARLFVLAGGNDVQQSVPLARTQAAVQAIVRSARTAGVPLTFVLPPPVNHALYQQVIVPSFPHIVEPTPERLAPIRDAIAASGLALDLVELLDSEQELKAAFTGDGLHLNGAGMRVVADELFALASN